VLEKLDALTAPYGGVGAYARRDQLSNAFLDGELVQLRGMAAIVPPIFLLVSAFLINMTLTRLIALEREQIGLLKALGYSRTAVAWHYVKFVLIIAAIGTVLGTALGTWAGRGMTVMYAQFYAFPFLLFQTDPSTYLIAAGISVAAAVAGAVQAIRTAFSLPAAVAMQPPVPPAYRQFLPGVFDRIRIFSALTVMALRHVARHAVRSTLSAFGIGFSVALMAMALGTIDSMNFMMDAVFFRTERQDASLSFSGARTPPALVAVERLPGVLAAEPFFAQAAELSNGHRTRQIGIVGKPAETDLSRVLDVDLKPVTLPESGLALGDRVAEILGVRLGDMVRVEFLDGLRRTAEVPVTQIIQNYIGLTVFMDMDALARLAGTGPRVSGVHVSIDPNRLDQLYAAVKDTPAVSAIALQSLAFQRFRETMEQNILLVLLVYLALSAVIAFGVVYNSARIQLSERARELAILRALGFRRAEVSSVLLIEIAIVVAAAQPIGWLFGWLVGYMVTSGLASDLFRVPFVVAPSTFAISTLTVGAFTALSALIVRRRIDRLDLIRVLKSRE
ncbi:MAG TPA: FtsX-like permease family protein, partial [Methylomirabilota bacterium]|nr:FtsX-like permease family protein [Methylomirabilota bacterium]